MYTKNEIPKSKNKLVGTVKISVATSSKLPIAHRYTLLCIKITKNDINTNDESVNKNSIANIKKSSTGPISFSLSCNIKNFDKKLFAVNCLI
jgi:hypothetical protein